MNKQCNRTHHTCQSIVPIPHCSNTIGGHCSSLTIQQYILVCYLYPECSYPECMRRQQRSVHLLWDRLCVSRDVDTDPGSALFLNTSHHSSPLHQRRNLPASTTSPTERVYQRLKSVYRGGMRSWLSETPRCATQRLRKHVTFKYLLH